MDTTGDTAWTVFLHSAPGGCSGNLSTSVLEVSLAAAATYDRWLELGAQMRCGTAPLCTVAVPDTFHNPKYDTYEPAVFQYLVDTARAVVTGLTVRGNGYALYEALYFYTQVEGINVVNRITLGSGDTSVSKGGFIFDSIRVNDTLADTTFQPAARRHARAPHRPPPTIDISGSGSDMVLRFNRTDEGPIEAVLTDPRGRAVYRTEFLSGGGPEVWSNRLGAGTYLLDVKSQSGHKPYRFVWPRSSR